MANRRERALQQRMFLLDVRLKDEIYWTFSVKGSSNSIYQLVLNPEKYSCSCPDHKNNHKICKHMMFLVIRVAKCSSFTMDSFENNRGRMTPEFYKEVSTHILKRIEKAVKESQQNQKLDKCPNDKLNEPCPICYEDLGSNNDLTSCENCFNWFHEECLTTWLNRGANQTCPYCRGTMNKDSNSESMDPFAQFRNFQSEGDKVEEVPDLTSFDSIPLFEPIPVVLNEVCETNQGFQKVIQDIHNGDYIERNLSCIDWKEHNNFAFHKALLPRERNQLSRVDKARLCYVKKTIKQVIDTTKPIEEQDGLRLVVHKDTMNKAAINEFMKLDWDKTNFSESILPYLLKIGFYNEDVGLIRKIQTKSLKMGISWNEMILRNWSLLKRDHEKLLNYIISLNLGESWEWNQDNFNFWTSVIQEKKTNLIDYLAKHRKVNWLFLIQYGLRNNDEAIFTKGVEHTEYGSIPLLSLIQWIYNKQSKKFGYNPFVSGYVKSIMKIYIQATEDNSLIPNRIYNALEEIIWNKNNKNLIKLYFNIATLPQIKKKLDKFNEYICAELEDYIRERDFYKKKIETEFFTELINDWDTSKIMEYQDIGYDSYIHAFRKKMLMQFNKGKMDNISGRIFYDYLIKNPDYMNEKEFFGELRLLLLFFVENGICDKNEVYKLLKYLKNFREKYDSKFDFFIIVLNFIYKMNGVHKLTKDVLSDLHFFYGHKKEIYSNFIKEKEDLDFNLNYVLLLWYSEDDSYREFLLNDLHSWTEKYYQNINETNISIYNDKIQSFAIFKNLIQYLNTNMLNKELDSKVKRVIYWRVYDNTPSKKIIQDYIEAVNLNVDILISQSWKKYSNNFNDGIISYLDELPENELKNYFTNISLGKIKEFTQLYPIRLQRKVASFYKFKVSDIHEKTLDWSLKTNWNKYKDSPDEIRALLYSDFGKLINIHKNNEEIFIEACKDGDKDFVEFLLTLEGNHYINVYAREQAAIYGANKRFHWDIVKLLKNLPDPRSYRNYQYQDFDILKINWESYRVQNNVSLRDKILHYQDLSETDKTNSFLISFLSSINNLTAKLVTDDFCHWFKSQVVQDNNTCLHFMKSLLEDNNYLLGRCFTMEQIWETLLLDYKNVKRDKRILFSLLKYSLQENNYELSQKYIDKYFKEMAHDFYQNETYTKWAYHFSQKNPEIARKIDLNRIIIGQAKRYANKLDYNIYDILRPERFNYEELKDIFHTYPLDMDKLEKIFYYYKDQNELKEEFMRNPYLDNLRFEVHIGRIFLPNVLVKQETNMTHREDDEEEEEEDED